jgi:peptide/nickel transport system substrate-binding protein
MFPMRPGQAEKSAEGYPVGNDVTADPAIRKAINYVLDRNALVAGILEGYGAPASGVVDGLPWDQKSGHITDNDPDKARTILKDAGWVDTDQDGIVEKNGLKAEFTLIYPSSDSIRQALALAAADMAAKAGIRINVVGKSWDDIPRFKHSDAILFGWGSHDPTEMYNLYYSGMAGQEYYNCGFYTNQTVDRHLDAAMTAASFDASLPHWQSAQWDGETGFMPPGDAAWAWLVNLTHTYFVNDCLDIGDSQMEPHGHGWPITANIETWQWKCR